MKKFNIGISISATASGNIWSSGINQNIGLLGMLLRKSPIVEKLWFLNAGDAEKFPPAMDFDRLGIPLVRPQEVTHEIDVMIEMGAILPLEWMKRIHARGAKIVCFGVGHNYNALLESLVFNKGQGITVADPSLRVETWGLLHHEKTCTPLMKALTRKPVVTMPHIWSADFLEKSIKEVEGRGHKFGFQGHSGAAKKPGWRVAIFEPNISVVKNYLVPMLVCEQAYRLKPDAVSLMRVMNSFHMKEHQTFLRFALNLDLTKHSKASYEPRVAFAELMATEKMDAVVAHHWECGMNYAYYDALYGGYPLIHNSEFLQRDGVGIYYPSFSASEGGRVLVEAWNQPPEFWQDYRRKAKEYLWTLHPENPENIRIFTERLMHVANAN